MYIVKEQENVRYVTRNMNPHGLESKLFRKVYCHQEYTLLWSMKYNARDNVLSSEMLMCKYLNNTLSEFAM